MQPWISYCPATMSPACSVGRKSNGAAQTTQVPAVVAGRIGVARPTGLPQRQQNRLPSDTTGSASTASGGSTDGTSGIGTRPAPSRRTVGRLWAVRTLRPVVRSGTDAPGSHFVRPAASCSTADVSGSSGASSVAGPSSAVAPPTDCLRVAFGSSSPASEPGSAGCSAALDVSPPGRCGYGAGSSVPPAEPVDPPLNTSAEPGCPVAVSSGSGSEAGRVFISRQS